MTAKLKAHF